MNKPYKLYFGEYDKTGLEAYSKKVSDKEIEYVHFDTFIKKTCSFLKDRIEHDSIDYPMATMHLLDDYKKFIKNDI